MEQKYNYIGLYCIYLLKISLHKLENILVQLISVISPLVASNIIKCSFNITITEKM